MPIAELDSSLNALAGDVLDAAFEIHRTIGPGFMESAYENALAIELKARRIPFVRQALAQLISYLKATGNELGFVMTFNVTHFKLGLRRVVYSEERRLQDLEKNVVASLRRPAQK